MGRFRNLQTGVVVSVDDSKDGRFEQGYEPADAEPKRVPAKKAAPAKSQK
jgi:hypothetical protein